MSDQKNMRYRNRLEARARAVREAHGLVVESGRVAGKVPAHMADWFYDLRRKQLTIYGGLLRFIDLSAQAGQSKAAIKQIPRWLDRYIDEAFDNTDRAA